MTSSRKWSNLDLVNRVDSFPYEETQPEVHAAHMQQLVVFTVCIGTSAGADPDAYPGFDSNEDQSTGSVAVGYAYRRVVDRIKQVPESVRGRMWDSGRAFGLFADDHTAEARTQRMDVLCRHLRDEGAFKLLRGWRNEQWACYAPTSGQSGHGRGTGCYDSLELLFTVERCAAGLFGINRFGAHMTAYVVPRPLDSSAETAGGHSSLMIWVPRRARDKKTWAGLLDNTVGGGLVAGEDPLDCIVREADEEAGLPEDVVRPCIKGFGAVSYVYLTEDRDGEGGYVYPECEWVYDLELPADVVPYAKDGEAEEFSLMTINEVKQHLANGEFKPNCGLVLLDFFIRHGILTKDNEPYFDEIRRRIHRKLPFPGPNRHVEG